MCIRKTRYVSFVLQELKIISAVSYTFPHSIPFNIRRKIRVYASVILRNIGKHSRLVMADTVNDRHNLFVACINVTI